MGVVPDYDRNGRPLLDWEIGDKADTMDREIKHLGVRDRFSDTNPNRARDRDARFPPALHRARLQREFFPVHCTIE